MQLPQQDTNHFERMPDELVLKIFEALGKIGPISTPEFDESAIRMPFFTAEPHPGLRAYPFLSQVCRRWKQVLTNPATSNILWREVIIDFGHELITAVHTPIAWSDRRPSDEEFRESFSHTRLSAARMVHFVEERQSSIRRLVLMNSEGYWSDEGDFVNLQQKHNFSMAHFGMMLGMLRTTLSELQIQHCNDFFSMGQGALSAISCLPRLRVLRIEDLHCRVDKAALAELARLTQLEELSLTGEEHVNAWAVGVEAIPEEWRALRCLRTLQLRGHTMLLSLPQWLAELPVTNLDVSFCRVCNVSVVSEMTTLTVLSLQGMDLTNSDTEVQVRYRHLPSLERLTQLTALNLADNAFVRVPSCLHKLKAISYLDLSLNNDLQVPTPLASLLTMPNLRVVDLRGVHETSSIGFWPEAKCVTMSNITALTKALKRRPYPTKVLVDVD
ncbi:g4608 [Coccomyxa elongata]